MPGQDFEPLERGPDNGHPLRSYFQPPPYLVPIAALQLVLALIMLALPFMTAAGTRPPAPLILSAALMTLAFAAAGVGLLRRRGWGWWITAALYYCVFFNLPVNLVRWTVNDQPFGLGANLVTFGLAVIVLVCLTRPELIRFIRFQTPDGRPARPTLISPALAGLGWSILHLLAALVRG